MTSFARHSLRWRSARLPILLLSLSLWLAGCSDPVKEAEFQAARGELEQAEATLGDASGKRARALRRTIEAYREDRIRAEEEIARFVAMAADGDQREAKTGLRQLASGLRDARAREAVDEARSKLSDLAAAEVTRRASAGSTALRGSTELPGEPEVDRDAHERELQRSMLDRIANNVEGSLEDRDWVRARSLIRMAVASSGADSSRLDELESRLEAGGRAEMESLLSEAAQVNQARGEAAAYNFLAAQASRFPGTGPLAAFHERMAEYQVDDAPAVAVAEPVRVRTPDRDRGTDRVRAPREPAPREPASPDRGSRNGGPTSPAEPTPSGAQEADEGAAELVVRATQLEEEGDLEGAQAGWLEAADAFPRGRTRTRARERARNLASRLALRSEVVAAAEASPEYFGLLGIESVDTRAFTIDGKPVVWAKVKEEIFERTILLTPLSNEARVGWILELLERENPLALDELAAALARDEIEEEQAFSILALARDESVPEEGYEYLAGDWIDRGAARRKELESELAALRKKLTGANEKRRDEHFAALVDMGADGRETLENALEKRWMNALSALENGATLGQLQKVATQRELLDERRAEALALIFDEEEYFYPYRPPECPPEKARLYPEVQQRVNALVAKVREVWDSPKRASLSKKFRGALEELAWNRLRQGELGLAFALPEDLPAWFQGLDPSQEEIDLHSFALNSEERAARAYDRAVLAYNEHNWQTYAAPEGKETSVSDTGEQQQVQITNGYRLMMGRRALSWNPLLQAASQGHSDWMSETGKFSHFNDEDPSRTTPGDRMGLEGYNSGISENLHRGGSGPDGAHYGWTQSSGHHRNLLMPGHREMASATAGEFWTQNYGVGRGFLEELKEWYD